MASKSSSGVSLIRQLLGKFNRSRSYPCLHHPRKLVFNSSQTLAPTSISTPCEPFSYSLPPPSFHLLQHRHLSSSSDSDKLCISSPPDIVIVSSKTAFAKALKQVKDGLLPAIFYYTKDTCAVEYSVICELREKFPHVTIYKIAIPYMDNGMTLFCMNKNAFNLPAFHFYKNGRHQVDHSMNHGSTKGLIETCEKLYRYVIPVEAIPPESPSSMALKGTQLVIRAKNDEHRKEMVGELKAEKHENRKGIVRELKEGRGLKVVRSVAASPQSIDSATLSRWRGATTMTQQSVCLPEAVTMSQQRCRLAEAVESKRKNNTIPSLDEMMRLVESLPGGFPGSKLWCFARGVFTGQPEKRMLFSKLYHATEVGAHEPSKRVISSYFQRMNWFMVQVFDE